ncbi:MAG TPA: type II toxin-antitoxin system HipA family toxin YjjJ, partial [Polyangiaceae bacterium]|nr:type II toxin-antitoxin system HipA family toxin YjjJ [Polyangiaceae bacterium]
VGPRVSVYEVDEAGRSRKLAWLEATAPEGFYVAALNEDASSDFYADLPYFLNDLRPSGFLGRLVPAQHPELALPPDVRVWSGDQCLRYLSQLGSNLVGNLIVGEPAFQRYLESIQLPVAPISKTDRLERYPELADDVLRAGLPGSSAGGKQPKFLVLREPGPMEVLVKFSPPRADSTSRRWADLLVSEHVAHHVLRRHGQSAAVSELVEAKSRIFLEVQRFDRTSAGGRRGLISLLSLDAQFVGQLSGWSEPASQLAKLGHLDDAMVERIRWLECFGHLIANSDMHPGNLSFLCRGTRVLAVAPAYDMLPMAYAPQQGHLTSNPFRPPVPKPAAASIWEHVTVAAQDFWREVAKHPLVSPAFRKVARENQTVVARSAALAEKLPS